MAQRRSLHRVLSSSSTSQSPLERKKYPLRHSSHSRQRAFESGHNLHPTPSSHDPGASNIRPVLVPLHPNLRRLPSRLFSGQKEVMRDASHNIAVGSKRKRVVSSNENAHSGGRPARGAGRMKRMRSTSSQQEYSSDEAGSSMDVDPPKSWAPSDSDEDDDDAADSCQSFNPGYYFRTLKYFSAVEQLVNEATPRLQLERVLLRRWQRCRRRGKRCTAQV
jgi:mitogen-activated protein kinase kinase kinase 13